MILLTEIKEKFNEDQCVLKEQNSHALHITAIKDNLELAKSTYAVLITCPLTELDYFSTVDNFVPDYHAQFLGRCCANSHEFGAHQLGGFT